MKPRAKKDLRKRSKAHIKRGVEVTKAKRTGDELSERDTVLRRLHEAVPAGIVFVDRNGQITFANARAMQVLGLKRSEIAKRTYNDPAWRLTTYDGRPLSDKDLPFQRVKAAGKPVFDVRHAILRPDGQRVLLSINAAPISDRSGRFGGVVAVVTDITRYVGAVEMLRESEGRYRQLLEASMDAVSVTVGRKFVYVNKRCAELLGFSDLNMLIGRDFTEFVAPEDREMVLARTLAREIGERQPPLYEFKIQRRDGTKVPVETNATAIEYEGKKAVLSFRRDITERKLAEQKLRLQGEIAENMFEGVVLTRASDGVIVYVNRRFEEMFGYGSGELIGKNIPTVNAPEEDRSPEDVAREIQANLREHGVWSGEVRNIKKDGTPFWCRANVSTLESPEYGAIWVATHEDITERKKMEVAVRNSEERFRSVFNNAHVGIALDDMNGHVLAANDAECRFLGYSQEEIVGMHFKEFTYPEDLDEDTELFEELMKGKRSNYTIDKRFIRKTGEIVSGRLQVSLIREIDGSPRHAIVICEDITERKQMEHALRESEENFRALAENAFDGILIATGEENHVYANKQAAEITGYSVAELLKTTIKDLAHPDEYKMVAERYHRRVAGELPPRSYEAVIVRKDGKSTPIELVATKTIWQGQPADIVFLRDITERKRMEDELRRSEERFRKIFQSSPIPATITLLEGPIVDVNEAWVRMSGYSREEAIGHSTIELGMLADPEQRDQILKDLLKKRRLSNVEITRQTKSGELRDLLNTLELVELDGQKCILNMQVDITDRRKMEAELEKHSKHLGELVEQRTRDVSESEEKYRALVNNLTDVVFTIDLKGNFTFCSQTGEKMTGYPVQQLLSMNMKEVIAQEHLVEIQERLQARMRGEKNLPPHEFEIIKADGKRLPVEMSTAPIVKKGSLVGIQGIAREITERKEMDRLREQATTTLMEDAVRRKELEKMKNQFISAVTHELRTPLVSIKGYLDLTLEGSESMTENVQSNLHVVKRNTDRLLGLVDDLLDLSRMQAGRLRLELQPMDFKTVIQSCMAEAKPLIEEKKLSVGMEVPDKPLPIQGDQVRLCEVLMNLLSNATKFSPEGSDVTLRVEEENKSIKVQVSDRGIGIRKEDLERVFEPFSAIEKPTYIKGTGLGLSITKGLVEAHGGKIRAESEGEGKGATFTFTLPKQETLTASRPSESTNSLP